MISQTIGSSIPPAAANPNPKRVLAGRANGKLSGRITEAERERRRTAIRIQKPWLRSTGPRTFMGKQKASQNSRKRPQGPQTADLQSRLSELARHVHSLRHKPLVDPISLDLTSGTLLRDLLLANLADINRSATSNSSDRLWQKGAKPKS